MNRVLLLIIVTMVMIACSSPRTAKNIQEKIPDISGTWFQNGDKAMPCYIVQNKEALVFLFNNSSSTGSFKSSYEVRAKEWNANAILSNNHETLTWPDRTWMKGTFTYPNIAGTWYENGEAAKRIIITQNKTKLVMDNGNEKLNGYFYTTNAIYTLENNNYGTYSPLDGTIKWGNKIWTKTSNK